MQQRDLYFYQDGQVTRARVAGETVADVIGAAKAAYTERTGREPAARGGRPGWVELAAEGGPLAALRCAPDAG